MKKEIESGWREEILRSCAAAEKLYRFESDRTTESWVAIYNANVIKKIERLLEEKNKIC